jgi:hypothetical protein
VPDAPESLFNDYADIIKKIVGDVHPTAQERALETATAFFLFAPSATCKGIGASAIKSIADKSLGGRPGAKAKSQDTLLAIIECEMATEVVDAMIARFQAKLPKLVVAAIQVLRAALMSFGPKVVSSKTVIKAIIPLFEHGDPGVRTEVSGIVVDFYRWAGAAMKTHIENLRSAQVTDLEKSFEGITPGAVPITRWLRSQKPDPATAAAEATSKPLLSALDFVDAVNVLAKLPKNWPAAVLEKEKWTERKELLDALVSAASVPKIASDNYSEVKLDIFTLFSSSYCFTYSYSCAGNAFSQATVQRSHDRGGNTSRQGCRSSRCRSRQRVFPLRSHRPAMHPRKAERQKQRHGRSCPCCHGRHRPCLHQGRRYSRGTG